MADPKSQFKDEPSLKDLLDLYRTDMFMSFNAHAIAKINKFNSTLQTVEATIVYKRSYLQTNVDGSETPYLVDYPLLVDVPLVIFGGTSATLTFPKGAIEGSYALILFNDRDFGTWFEGTDGKGVPSRRMHSFGDGIAIIGLRSKGNSVMSYDEDRALLKNGATGVGVSATKVKIFNATLTLNGVLQELTTELTNLVTQINLITVTCAAPASPSGPPLNAVAIAAIGTQISATATKIGNLLE